MKTFHLVSLGCAKNLVDSEVMLGVLDQAGWQLRQQPEDADVLLVNTCGFIMPAVEEGIEEILQLAEIKKEHPEKFLVVTGCMVQRYGNSLPEELPEVDLFLGTEGPGTIVDKITALVTGRQEQTVHLPDRFLMDSNLPRKLATPFYRAWMKITEGCDNRCSYCMIPSIRGGLRSRGVADLLAEAHNLESAGVKEISLIAQDLTAYGNDLGKEDHLVHLLKALLQQTTLPWIRLLYLYPTGITTQLLQLMADQPRILPYLDIPFQHVSDPVLQRMNRRYSYDDLVQLVTDARCHVPDIALRTTFLVGFPGETEEDIARLETFIRTMQLDHVGVFAYENEEGCSSEHFADQCSEFEKNERVAHILAVQAEVSQQIQKKYIGSLQPVLVEGVSKETELLLEGRTRFQAPDIDGCVYINEGEVSVGEIVNVRISEAQVYDLVGGVERAEDVPRL